MLADLVRKEEWRKAGLIDPHEEQKKAPIESQIGDYEAHLRNKGVSRKHLVETIRRLRAVLKDCKIRALAEFRIDSVERFLASMAERGDSGPSTRTRNTYRTSAKAFSKWCFKTRRLGEDVLASLEPASGAIRRQRRALTDEELTKLLKTTRERPLKEALTVRRGKKKGQLEADIRPEVRADLERLGWERSLMYKVLVMTGLRRGELQALEARNLSLDSERPRLTLPGALTKNGDEASIPLVATVATELKEWLAATGRKGSDRVFRVPLELIKILKRDLKAAGIPYRDDRGRTVDVHALRHTTATMLARAKVSPRIAQLFMRHSDIKLTMQVYTDPRLLDEEEALNAFPELPSGGDAVARKGLKRERRERSPA
jgi:integrase